MYYIARTYPDHEHMGCKQLLMQVYVRACIYISYISNARWLVVAQYVKALRYKPEDRGFVSRWCHWNFSLTYSFLSHYGPGVELACNRKLVPGIFPGG